MTDMDMDAQTRGAVGVTELDEGDDIEVVALVDDIEQTRDEMTVTVEEIGDRLDPRNIVEGAKETVREATVGKVENMASTAGAMVGDAGETVREAGSGIIDRITKNPIPAAMVGLGIGWLALSGRSSQGDYRRDDRWRRPSGTGVMDRTAYGDASEGGGIQQRAGEVADRVGRTVDDVTGQVGRAAEQVPYQVRSTADQIGSEAGRLYQSNPLAVGAIAVAVGTAVGLAMPATQIERRAMGQPARQLLERAEEAATDAIETVEETARDVEQQARRKSTKAKAH